ncbi:MAG: hypothetical protein ACRDZ3_22790, partial [Acidimicrobiia bacterium]
ALLPGPQAELPAVVTIDDTVHVVACEFRNEDDPADTADLLYYRGTGDGTTTIFAPPRVLATPVGCNRPAIDGNGENLHIVFRAEDRGLDDEVWYVQSDDAGDTFSTARNLSNNPMGSSDPSVSVDPEDNRDVHVSWNDQTIFLFALRYGQELPLEEGDERHFANEDIIQYTGKAYRMILDGSDVGLRRFRIDALARLSDLEFVLSFTESGPVPGVGRVDDSDLVLFTADNLGESTSGQFSLWLDGSDLDLRRSGEDLDAIEVVHNEDATVDLYFSTTGDFAATGGTTGKDEDVAVCRGLTRGPESSCTTIAVGFDGSVAGLTSSGEDVDAFSFDGVGPGLDDERFSSYYSTTGDFNVSTAEGEDSDAMQCFHAEAEPAAANPLTECGSSLPLLRTFIGKANLVKEDLMALEFPFQA